MSTLDLTKRSGGTRRTSSEQRAAALSVSDEWLKLAQWRGRRLTDDDGEPMITVKVPRASGDDGQGGYHSSHVVRHDVCRAILNSPLIKEVLEGGDGRGADVQPQNKVGGFGIVEDKVPGETGDFVVQFGKRDVVAVENDGENGGGKVSHGVVESVGVGSRVLCRVTGQTRLTPETVIQMDHGVARMESGALALVEHLRVLSPEDERGLFGTAAS